MRFQWSVLLLLGGLAYGQATTPPAPSNLSGSKAPQATQAAAAETKAAEPKVAPSDAVITLKNFCDDPAKQGDACRTLITREQFEKMADALQPHMSPAVRHQLATAYARMLMMSTAAAKMGLDKTSQYDEMMLFARMQILSQALGRHLQEEAGKVSDSDVEKYYNENQRNYDQATVLRIFVPHNKQIAAPLPTVNKAGVKLTEKEKNEVIEARQKAGEAAMKKTADSLRARAATGEDFDKLEKDAYLAAGLKQTPPTTKMEKIRRNTLPPAHSAAFDLKPEEVSPVFSDASGHTIYKMVSKQTLALDAVKAEVHNTIASKRYSDAMQAYQLGANLDLNEAYFGPTRNPAMPPIKKGEKPPAEDVDPD